MPYEQKEGHWSIFKNNDKKNDNAPDYSGSVKVNGTEYKLAGWVRESSSGRKYVGGTLQPADERRQPSNYGRPQQQHTTMRGQVQQSVRPLQAMPESDFDDDIPFSR